MIFDSLDNFKNYIGLHAHFKSAKAFVANPALADLDLGRHDIGKAGAYMSISAYQTKAAQDGFIECHRKFIDIQLVLEGVERIGVCPASACQEISYDPEKDLVKLEGAVEFLTLRPGYFMIFFPQDGHMPGVKRSVHPENIIKAVIKIPCL